MQHVAFNPFGGRRLAITKHTRRNTAPYIRIIRIIIIVHALRQVAREIPRKRSDGFTRRAYKGVPRPAVARDDATVCTR